MKLAPQASQFFLGVLRTYIQNHDLVIFGKEDLVAAISCYLQFRFDLLFSAVSRSGQSRH